MVFQGRRGFSCLITVHVHRNLELQASDETGDAPPASIRRQKSWPSVSAGTSASSTTIAATENETRAAGPWCSRLQRLIRVTRSTIRGRRRRFRTIVAERQTEIQRLTVAQAVARLDLSGLNALLFGSDGRSLGYRRSVVTLVGSILASSRPDRWDCERSGPPPVLFGIRVLNEALVAPTFIDPIIMSAKDSCCFLARRVAEPYGVAEREVLSALEDREQEGSTGAGEGVAIPHAKLPGLSRTVTYFARLQDPVSYDSHDDIDVDLVFLILAPETANGDHLKLLAQVSRPLKTQRSASVCAALKTRLPSIFC